MSSSFQQILKERVRILTIVVVIYIAIVFLYLFFIQIVLYNYFTSQSQDNQTQLSYIPAYRSIIYDSTGRKKLAYNQSSISLMISPKDLPKTKEDQAYFFTNLSKFLNLSVDEVKAIVYKKRKEQNTPILIKEKVTKEDLIRFGEQRELYPGIYWENTPIRIYPYEKATAHIIGYTGKIDPDERENLRGNPLYHLNSIIGKSGIEETYDEKIRGVDGVLARKVDNKVKIIDENIYKNPIAGDSFYLTIHAGLQNKVFELLKPYTGSVIVSNPSTGEILALASSPSFDPNNFVDDFDQDNFDLLLENTESPFINRAIQGIYPPASTFKLIVSTAALLDDYPVEDRFYCGLGMQIGNRFFKNWTNHKQYVTMPEAFEISCNSYFYNIGLIIGRDSILNTAKLFGINEKSFIDLPGEKVGFIPSKDWFQKVHKRLWSDGDTANISIGQGDLLITPLTLHLITNTIVMNGKLYKPFIGKEIKDNSTGQILWKNKPKVIREIELDDGFQYIKDGMRLVASGPKGTGRSTVWRTRVPMAVKTGTSQTGSGIEAENHGIVTGFAPFGAKPEDSISITVILEDVGSSSYAVAVAAAVVDYYYKYVESMPELVYPDVVKR